MICESYMLPIIQQERVNIQHFMTKNLRSIYDPDFSAYTWSVNVCLRPLRKVQDELISLYFRHIHPTFPVVDEHQFTVMHHKYKQHEQYMERSQFLIYHAILTVGISVRQYSVVPPFNAC